MSEATIPDGTPDWARVLFERLEEVKTEVSQLKTELHDYRGENNGRLDDDRRWMDATDRDYLMLARALMNFGQDRMVKEKVVDSLSELQQMIDDKTSQLRERSQTPLPGVMNVQKVEELETRPENGER